ncbi:ATP-binding protein [Bradyrhizobium sp. USDA 4473]
MSEIAPPIAERRHVTVLFADMVGFTSISERLGEEGTFTLIHPIYELMANVVKEQGGSVKDFTGDGIMALFGAPDGIEDAPLRACQAALLIHQRLAAAAPAIEARHGVRPQMRIGINTGPAVVTRIRGDDASMTALGDTVNTAARLQTLAGSGKTLLSESTYRLVHGLVDANFDGEHDIKGKSAPQKTFKLVAVRKGAARFDAALSRGLTEFVGREREMETLDQQLRLAQNGLRIVDVAAEPGMGKSRLLHEFQQRISAERISVLRGHCSPDGKLTPFLPFVEVVRSSFQVSIGEDQSELTRKLETGLGVLGLHSVENIGLLLNLLGLTPPEASLAGLDGLLIGLRTRDLLQQLLEASCRVSMVVMLIEDLHWIDGGSEELLGKIIDHGAALPLLIVHTRRLESAPAWLDAKTTKTLNLDPLPVGEIHRLVRARLGVSDLTDALARQLATKAEGNPLFAEEIVTFLIERGVIRLNAGRVEFDAEAVAATLPASVQGLLTARVDRLATADRALLQAAAVIGRAFEADLLAAVADVQGEIGARLLAMRSLDLIHGEQNSSIYVFKHALGRDALYQSLLTEPRKALHLRIGQEIERRQGNRLAEVAEILAHHYSQTDRAEKAFVYFALAGAKSLGVYSLEEANKYLAAAVALLESNPACAVSEQIASLLVDHLYCLNLLNQQRSLIETVERFSADLARLGDNQHCVLIQHYHVVALLLSGRNREAAQRQIDLTAMADRLGDARSRAYAISSDIHVSTIVAPRPREAFETLGRDAIRLSSSTGDPYPQAFTRYALGWEEIHRGRISEARQAAQELLAVGRKMNDPRSIGLGLQVEAWIALIGDDYAAALDYAEMSISMARAPFDTISSTNAKISALVLLRRPEAFAMLRAWIDECETNGWYWALSGAEGIMAIAMALRGEIAAALRWMKRSISKRESEGYYAAADWYRMFLCEIYLEIIAGKERPPIGVLWRNAASLVSVMFGARRQIVMLVNQVKQNSRFDANAHHFGRCEMILGLLYQAKKKPGLALQHLVEAQRIAGQYGATPMLARIESAMSELRT